MVWSKELEPKWWLREAAGGGTKGFVCGISTLSPSSTPSAELWEGELGCIELQVHDLGRTQPFPKIQCGVGPSGSGGQIWAQVMLGELLGQCMHRGEFLPLGDGG